MKEAKNTKVNETSSDKKKDKKNTEHQPVKLSDKQIQKIAEMAVGRITDSIKSEKKTKDSQKDIVEVLFNVDIENPNDAQKNSDLESEESSRSNTLDNYFKVEHLEPKKSVFKHQAVTLGVEIAGWGIIAGCIAYFIYFSFILQNFEPLTYTTYLTLILIGLTCINKFESVLLNSTTCITVYGFLTISIWFFNVTNDFGTLIVGPILHGAMGLFQLFLIVHPRIPMSKRYLIWGFFFYLLFLSSYDTYQRLNIITGSTDVFSELMTMVHGFYTLSLSLLGIYLYKKKFGILLP
ncbi:MAG: hypothetical protein R6U96_19475 [Promethearchaeia archaeon]